MAEAATSGRGRFSITHQPGFAAIATLCFVLLYLPIAVLTVYSFNSGVSIAIWEGFSFRWYEQAWQNRHVQEASIRSLIIACFASAIATTAYRPFTGMPRIRAACDWLPAVSTAGD